jgi:MerR family mercuric resistance operon transcriptional regulator
LSQHLVRDYLLRGLQYQSPAPRVATACSMTPPCSDCFVRAAFEAGIGLGALARLCRALDAANCDETAAQLAVLRQFVERRREALANLEVQLAAMPTAPAQHAESLP